MNIVQQELITVQNQKKLQSKQVETDAIIEINKRMIASITYSEIKLTGQNKKLQTEKQQLRK